jgi:hypothetical protein
VSAYPWYCPDCGREDYGYEDDDKKPKICSECGGELCRVETEPKEKSDSEPGVGAKLRISSRPAHGPHGVSRPRRGPCYFERA